MAITYGLKSVQGKRAKGSEPLMCAYCGLEFTPVQVRCGRPRKFCYRLECERMHERESAFKRAERYRRKRDDRGR